MALDTAFLPDPEPDPHHTSSPTAHLLDEFQLFG